MNFGCYLLCTHQLAGGMHEDSASQYFSCRLFQIEIKKTPSCLVRVVFLLMTFCVIHLCSLNSRVTVYGAAGGRSVLTTSRSHGAYMTGDLLLNKGELLYILVGQRGEDACPNVSRLYNNSRQFRKSAIAQ